MLLKSQQLECLINPLRAQILEELLTSPGSSAGELAHSLGMKTEAVLYHLKALERVGLTSCTIEGQARGRPARRHRAAFDRLQLNSANQDPAYRLLMLKWGQRSLLAAQREMEQAHERAMHDQVMARRSLIRIKPERAKALAAKIAELLDAEDATSEPGDDLYSFTCLILPRRDNTA